MHRNKALAGVLTCVAIWLSGCAATRGPQPIVSATGPTNTTATTGLAKQFIASAGSSFGNPHNPALAHTMMSDGFALIYANCSDYFLSAGETQKWIIFSRDAVGAIGSLTTAIFALHDGGKNAAANMALLTGAGLAGLDIYTKNFLFSAENISAVRTLTTNALSAHQKAVETIGTVTYRSATMALFDNQEICSPMKIAALAREAIQKGVVVAAPDSATDLATISLVQDQKVLETLGKVLNPPGALSVDQAGALWWLLKEASTDSEKKSNIGPKLKDLPSDTRPFDSTGNFIAGWTNDQVASALNGFSDATKASFRTTIAAARAGKATATAASPAVTPPAAPTFQAGSVAPAPASTHFSVGIR